MENENNFSSFINDCIIIENDIKDINNINSNIDKCNSINCQFNFIPLEDSKDFRGFVKGIKKFGNLCYEEEKKKDYYKKENEEQKKDDEKYDSVEKSYSDKKSYSDEKSDSEDEQEERRF